MVLNVDRNHKAYWGRDYIRAKIELHLLSTSMSWDVKVVVVVVVVSV